MKKSLGEKLAMLAKSQEKSQADIADSIGMAPSQLNRFFKGHSDIYSSNVIEILKELGLDIEAIVTKKLKAVDESEYADPKSQKDALFFLFNELDELGKQTYLSQLLWAAKLSKGDSFPKKVEEQIKREMTLI